MNTLFLMADEMSWWALTDPRIYTPNLEALARRGCRFDAAYTPSPICVPARAAVACGRDIHEIGYWSSAEPYDGRVKSWGLALQSVGVEPVSFGKLHYRSAEDDTGFVQQVLPTHVVGGIGWVTALMRKPSPPNETSDTMARDIGPGETDYIRYDRDVTKAAVEWLEADARKAKPWSAFVSWFSPHFPLIAPPEDFARYDPQLFESEADLVPDHPVIRELERYFDHDRAFTPQTRGIGRAGYFALCTFVDRQIGKVLKALEKTGQDDNTLIIFASDHGEMLGEKGFWAKSTMYESAVRVPLIMAGPGVAPLTWPHPVSLIDIAPTICAAMGASADGFSGRDLRQADSDRAVISSYHDGGAPVGITMLRWDAWKLVHYAEGHPPQLFNIADDPAELTDLAETHPQAFSEGMTLLTARLDPEAVNQRAFADQARRVAALGGEQAVLNIPIFDYTPAESG